MLVLARGWLVYEMTNSPFMLGIVTGAFSIPVIFLAIPGGAIADRVSKRNLMMAPLFVIAFLHVSIAILIAINLISVWHLIVASFISGILFSVEQPAKQAIIPEIVGRDLLMNAIALSSVGFNLMRVIAPAVAGFLVAYLGIAPVYFIGAALTVLGVLFLLLLPQKDSPQERPGASFNEDMMAGIKYMYQNKTVMILFILILIATLFSQPFQFFLPVFARDILKVGETGLGWMMAASGIGAVISTLGIASLGDYRKKSYLLLSFMGLTGLFLVFFSFTTNFILSMIFLVMLGMFVPGFNTMSNTMLQTYSSLEMRGRVMSIMTVAYGLAPLGAMPLGAVAEIIGTPQSLAIGGSLASLFAFGIVIFNKGFRRL